MWLITEEKKTGKQASSFLEFRLFYVQYDRYYQDISMCAYYYC